MIPSGSTSVMARRAVTAPDELDYFPTPPWATRAFLPILRGIAGDLSIRNAWEPACGEGHMASVLREAFAYVEASDIFDYGFGKTFDFLGHVSPFISVDWIISNPPFNVAADFVELALERADIGVAMLLRSTWAESRDRYERLFSTRPPALIAQYVERVPMVKGRWDPNASTATGYAWFVWMGRPEQTVFQWIPPGARETLTRSADLVTFAAKASTPLFDGEAA